MSFDAHRACDRCHVLKERCQGRRSGAACNRCNRLGFECLVQRPCRKPGRPRRFGTVMRADFKDRQVNDPKRDGNQQCQDLGDLYSTLSPVVPRYLPHFNDLTSSDQRLIQDMLFGDTALDCFLIGPSFWQKHRAFLISHFVISRHALKDAYLAVALAFEKRSGTVDSTQYDAEAGYKHASSALKHLREYRVHSSHGVSESLALGALILSFTYCSTQPDSSAICRRTLSLVKDSYESGNGFYHDELVFMSCLILPEILHCLIHGSVPTLRFRPQHGSESHIDRYVGLCSPLLPYLYDICKLNNALSHADHQDIPQILEALDQINLTVMAWRPDIPTDFTTRFTTTEVSHMLCQVHVMRLGAMLIIHRLRYPFGSSDDLGLAIALGILTQLDLARTATNKSILSITLPLVVACSELKSESEREIWRSRIPELVGYSFEFGNYLQRLVSSLWEARDDMQVASWYNIGSILRLAI